MRTNLLLALALLAAISSPTLADSSSSSTAAAAAPSTTAAACTSWHYLLTHNASQPTPLELDGPLDLPPADDAVAPFDFGFAFTFFGRRYTAVNVSTNGNLQFESASIAWVDSAFPLNLSTPQPVPVVAAYYVDLNPDHDYMQQTAVLGTAPNRRAIIRYNAVPVCPFDQNATHNDTANDPALLDAQPAVSCDVLLYESDSHIDVRYYDVDPTPWPVGVGVQGGGADGWTAAVDHMPMDESMVAWLANSTLSFAPVCLQYQAVHSTGGRGGAANGAGLRRRRSLYLFVVIVLLAVQLVL